MTEIKNTKVYNLKEAVVASGNAMRLAPQEITEAEFQKSLERCQRLSKIGGGTGHSNFRTGILVSFDLKYPQYLSKQMQRYHWLQLVSSTSTMHTITKMRMEECCNEHVSEFTVSLMNDLIRMHNRLKDTGCCDEAVEEYMNFITLMGYDNIEDDLIYDSFMKIVSECPMGLQLWVHVSTNYEQLATIYKQRQNHKLKDDWGAICKWIESLPYSKELITV